MKRVIYLRAKDNDGGAYTNDRSYANALLMTGAWEECTFEKYRSALAKAQRIELKSIREAKKNDND